MVAARERWIRCPGDRINCQHVGEGPVPIAVVCEFTAFGNVALGFFKALKERIERQQVQALKYHHD